MFEPTSRYYDLETAEIELPDGRVVVYKRRRFILKPETFETLVEIKVEQGDRLDRITAQTLGDPLQFWRILDANEIYSIWEDNLRQRVIEIEFRERFFKSKHDMLSLFKGKNRAAALLPLYHIAVIPFSRIYPSIEAWFEVMRNEGDLDDRVRGCSQLTFVTGPSKSADIELNLTLGVHGPKMVHALMFDDR